MKQAFAFLLIAGCVLFHSVSCVKRNSSSSKVDTLINIPPSPPEGRGRGRDILILEIDQLESGLVCPSIAMVTHKEFMRWIDDDELDLGEAFFGKRHFSRPAHEFSTLQFSGNHTAAVAAIPLKELIVSSNEHVKRLFSARFKKLLEDKEQQERKRAQLEREKAAALAELAQAQTELSSVPSDSLVSSPEEAKRLREMLEKYRSQLPSPQKPSQDNPVRFSFLKRHLSIPLGRVQAETAETPPPLDPDELFHLQENIHLLEERLKGAELWEAFQEKKVQADSANKALNTAVQLVDYLSVTASRLTLEKAHTLVRDLGNWEIFGERHFPTVLDPNGKAAKIASTGVSSLLILAVADTMAIHQSQCGGATDFMSPDCASPQETCPQ